MKVGKPCHFQPTNAHITACGIVGTTLYAAHDARDCDCLRCKRTHAYRAYMGTRGQDAPGSTAVGEEDEALSTSETFAKLLAGDLDSLEQEKKLSLIDDMLRRLTFERRLAGLDLGQLKALQNPARLSPAQHDRLDGCATKKQREELVQAYARNNYFRECAWASYLHGATDEPPVAAGKDGA